MGTDHATRGLHEDRKRRHSRGGKDVYLTNGPYALIRSQNIYNDGFHHGGLAYISEQHASELANVEVLDDDVLLNITGDSVARACQVDPSILPARVNQHVAIIRPHPEELDPRFLRYYLVTPEMQVKLLSWAGSGGTRNALTKGMIESFEVVAPKNINEQRAIAHILGTLDDKIELNRRMNETLEAMARALFKSWFVDFDPVRAKCRGEPMCSPQSGQVPKSDHAPHSGQARRPAPTEWPQHILDLFPDRFVDSELGEIPEGWEVATLSGICEKPQYGYTASASDETIGPRFLRITDINKRDWIEWESVPFCAIETLQREKYVLALGDIVIARMADPGHGALIEEVVEAVFASYLIRFRPQQPEFGRFLQYWLRSETYWDSVRSRQSGTTRANLNAQVLGNFPLVVSDRGAIQQFSIFVGALRNRVVANARESRTLANLRDTLLPKLISGELRVKGAERFVEKVGA